MALMISKVVLFTSAARAAAASDMFMVTRLEATIEVTQRCAWMVNDRLTIYSFRGGREVSQSSSLLPEPLNGSKQPIACQGRFDDAPYLHLGGHVDGFR